ncbi:hypothetical protein DICPUDRAFT_157372 [Dictyostelium purpureum]|uniref:CBS domain-containing protein n=1 Tax=Dictyostelium purpureum TaxID=5786 RepID=F0ZYZ0_DICPU|nr:uncharacterized protein DICPUDRAFT_157372 [Dictyostelium purpureum]EGC30846.1 hypothetical protein DICPUDRAFT_157372 [Dictyostelium purpureum]|eukprot:XP_003292635.1 hypothetical protein DICPUDRAFT_157372 [Dictyostelium purpureum]
MSTTQHKLNNHSPIHKKGMSDNLEKIVTSMKNPLQFLQQPISNSTIVLQKVKILDTDISIEEGFSTIINQLSAPVFDKKEGKFIGIIDLKHFLSYILYKLPFPPTGEYVSSSIKEMDLFPFHTLDKKSSILQLLKYFDSGVHRAFILNENKQIEMISQLDILKWFKDNSQEFGELKNKDVLSLDRSYNLHSFSKVHSINQCEPVFKALQDIQKYKIYGMPVVDDKNTIVGNISIHDIKYASENLDRLALPLNMYIKEKPPVTCEKTTTLAELFNIFLNHRIHRVHLVESGKPIGIITITDIISMIYNYTISNSDNKSSSIQM